MAGEAEKMMQAALTALNSLEEKVDKSGLGTDTFRESIKSLGKNVEMHKSLKLKDTTYIEGAEGIVSVAQCVSDNLDKFTSDDPLEIVSGAIALIGTIGGVVGGPYEPFVVGVCGLVVSIFPILGGKKGPSMPEMINEVIRRELDDFRDEEIYGKVIGSLKKMTTHIAHLNGVASHNFGLLTNEEKAFLTQINFSTIGADALGELQGQIEKYKSIKNDEKKSQRIAKYAYFYCMIAVQRNIILTLQCSLLKVNNMEALFSSVSKYLNEEQPMEDQKVLEFVSTLPSKDWFVVYRCLHLSLTAPQRGILSNYTKLIGCPMKGKLCCIYSNYRNAYMYLPQDHLSHDKDRRNVFTWKNEKDCNPQMLFRLIGDEKNCQIFGVYFGEYLYSADDAPYNNNLRRVFTLRNGAAPTSDWEIRVTDGANTIRSRRHNEYMYASDISPGRLLAAHFNSSRKLVFTWRPGQNVPQDRWTVKEVSFETNDLNVPF